MSLLWPRLPRAVADQRLTQVRATETHLIADLVAFDHPAQVFAATGGARATIQDLRDLREIILDTASAFSFPSTTSDTITFDRILAPRLVDAMRISAAEAACPAVWSFTSLILCPDITVWRFSTQNSERWVASDLTRHMFSRLWWQAFLLTEPLPGGHRNTDLLNRLSESDLNQLLERTRIGGVRPLVRALARHVVEHEDAEVPRRLLIRETTRRIRREMSIIDFLALTSEQLEARVAAVTNDAASAIRASSVQ